MLGRTPQTSVIPSSGGRGVWPGVPPAHVEARVGMSCPSHPRKPMSRAGREGAEPSRILKYLSKALDLQTCSSGGREANRSLSSGIWRGLQPATGGLAGMCGQREGCCRNQVSNFLTSGSPPFFFLTLYMSAAAVQGASFSVAMCVEAVRTSRILPTNCQLDA